jgi:hypothetical protein
MTKFRAIDGDNDWVFGSGIQSYARDNLSISYDIKTKLQTFLTECFFDNTIGLPWFQLLGGKDKDALILGIKQAIANVEGVTQVLELDFSLNADRNAIIRYTVNTIYTQQLVGTVNL